jgi:hypothetical protein
LKVCKGNFLKLFCKCFLSFLKSLSILMIAPKS